MFGWSETEALAMNTRQRIPAKLADDELFRLRQLSRAETLEPYRTHRITKVGKSTEVSIISTPLVNDAGNIYAITTTERSVAAGGKDASEG